MGRITHTTFPQDYYDSLGGINNSSLPISLRWISTTDTVSGSFEELSHTQMNENFKSIPYSSSMEGNSLTLTSLKSETTYHFDITRSAYYYAPTDHGDTNIIPASGSNLSSTLGNAGRYNVTLGGDQNDIITNSEFSSIVNGVSGSIEGAKYSTILGGLRHAITNNSTINDYSAILGGHNNSIRNSNTSAIVGGNANGISANSSYSTVAGGQSNSMSSVQHSAIVGGQENSTTNAVSHSTILGGFRNGVSYTNHSAILGGQSNSLEGSSTRTLESIFILGSGISLNENTAKDNTTYVNNLDVSRKLDVTGSVGIRDNLKVAGSTYLGNSDTDIVQITGSVLIKGRLTATELHTEYTSASIIYESGSTKFGDTQDDNHAFTGSLSVSGTIIALDGIQSLTSSFAVTASHTPEAYVSSSIDSASIAFYKGDGSKEGFTVNHVVSSSYALSSSYAVSSSYAKVADTVRDTGYYREEIGADPNNSVDIIHNLNEQFVIVQAYSITVDPPEMVLPATVRLENETSLSLTFSENFNGWIVVKR